MKQIRWTLTMVLLFVLLPIVVMAEAVGIPATEVVVDAAEKAGWMKIIWEIISLALGVISAVAISVITALIYKHFGIKLKSGHADMFRNLANQAINYAEQRAKAGAIDPGNRAQVALDFMTRAAKSSKLPSVAAERLSEYIEAELGLINTANGKTLEKN